MSKLAELLKGGAKLVSNVGEDYVVKLPSHLGGKEVNIPKHMLGLGNVEVKAAEQARGLGKVSAPDMEKALIEKSKGYGSVSTPDMDKPVKEGFGDILNPRSNGDLQQMMNKQPIDLRPSANPMEERLKAMAKGGAMNMVGGNNDMMSGSLGALKDLGNKYEEDIRKPIKEGMANLVGAKDSSDEAIGKRILSPFDITKDKGGFPEIEGAVGDYATDPMSLTDLIPGKAQAGALAKGAKETLPMLKKLLMR